MSPAGAEDPSLARRPSRGLVAGVAAVVLAVAALGYWRTGTPDYAQLAADAAAQAPVNPHAAGGEMQIEPMIAKLQEHLKGKPEDGQGWAMLGRAQMMVGKLDEAIAAFKSALPLRPDDARLLTDYAEALGVKAGQSLAGEPTKLLDRALTLDPQLPKTLALSGAAAFDRKDYAKAVQFWEQLLAGSPPDAEFVQQIKAGIAEARQQGGLAAPATAAAAAPTVSVSGTVQLAEALKSQAAPEDTLFVFARAAEGPRMPLALIRKQVKDLPLTFTLDDQMAMNPAMKLSAFPRVVVVARISKSGQATAQPGDLSGESAPVALGTKDLKVEVREVVKP